MAETNLNNITPEQLDLANSKLIVASKITDASRVAWKFYLGDHWQGGDGYIGSVPPGEAGTLFITELQKGWVFYNGVAEATNRHADAAISREPRWGASTKRVLKEIETRTPDEETRIGELDGALRDWWDDAHRATYTDKSDNLETASVHEALKRAAKQRAVLSRATLRIFIPPSEVDDQGKLEKKPFKESLDRIYVELCPPGVATVHTARRSMKQVGVYTWEEDGTEVAEISYLDKDGRTVLRQVTSEEKEGEEKAAPVYPSFDLARNLFHHEMSGDALIDEAFLSQQKSTNKTLIMGDRTMTTAGFPERVLTEAQLNGELQDDPANPGKKKLVNASALTFGAGTINNVMGIKYVDPMTQQTKRTTPTYQRMDPIGTELFDQAFLGGLARMRGMVSQTHVEISGDATPSGRSREQARHEFNKSLGDTVAGLNRAGRWLLNTVVALAADTSTDAAERYKDYFIDFSCRLDLGPIDATESGEDRERVKAQLMSRETAMVRRGEEDTDTENGRITSEVEGSRAAQQEKANLTETLTRAGSGFVQAAQAAGFDRDTVAILKQGDFVPEDENKDDPPLAKDEE